MRKILILAILAACSGGDAAPPAGMHRPLPAPLRPPDAYTAPASCGPKEPRAGSLCIARQPPALVAVDPVLRHVVIFDGARQVAFARIAPRSITVFRYCDKAPDGECPGVPVVLPADATDAAILSAVRTLLK